MTKHLKVGAVARILQIPVGTIRTWNQREYLPDLEPDRAPGQWRRYSRDDVLAIGLMSELVTYGSLNPFLAGKTVEGFNPALLDHTKRRFVCVGHFDDGTTSVISVAHLAQLDISRWRYARRLKPDGTIAAQQREDLPARICIFDWESIRSRAERRLQAWAELVDAGVAGEVED